MVREFDNFVAISFRNLKYGILGVDWILFRNGSRRRKVERSFFFEECRGFYF